MGCPVQGQQLELKILGDPCQLRVFHGFIPWLFFSVLSFGGGAVEGFQGTCASLKCTFLVHFLRAFGSCHQAPFEERKLRRLFTKAVRIAQAHTLRKVGKLIQFAGLSSCQSFLFMFGAIW